MVFPPLTSQLFPIHRAPIEIHFRFWIMTNLAAFARCIFSPPVRTEWLEFFLNIPITPLLSPSLLFPRLISTCTQISTHFFLLLLFPRLKQYPISYLWNAQKGGDRENNNKKKGIFPPLVRLSLRQQLLQCNWTMAGIVHVEYWYVFVEFFFRFRGNLVMLWCTDVYVCAWSI